MFDRLPMSNVVDFVDLICSLRDVARHLLGYDSFDEYDIRRCIIRFET
jgi:hypothetical protein